MRSEIKALNSLCKENNSQLRLVIFPFLHNLGDDYPFKKAHSQISEACREMEIPTFDLLPVLSKRRPTELTVNRLDAHPNELAHELAAEAIEQELLKDLVGVD
jgi:lysophospholipase L1-like esterase